MQQEIKNSNIQMRCHIMPLSADGHMHTPGTCPLPNTHLIL